MNCADVEDLYRTPIFIIQVLPISQNKRHCKLLACSAFIIFIKYSRWESNPNLRFRKPPFYPLNYRSIKTSAGVALTPADALVITCVR